MDGRADPMTVYIHMYVRNTLIESIFRFSRSTTCANNKLHFRFVNNTAHTETLMFIRLTAKETTASHRPAGRVGVVSLGRGHSSRHCGPHVCGMSQPELFSSNFPSTEVALKYGGYPGRSIDVQNSTNSYVTRQNFTENEKFYSLFHKRVYWAHW